MKLIQILTILVLGSGLTVCSAGGMFQKQLSKTWACDAGQIKEQVIRKDKQGPPDLLEYTGCNRVIRYSYYNNKWNEIPILIPKNGIVMVKGKAIPVPKWASRVEDYSEGIASLGVRVIE